MAPDVVGNEVSCVDRYNDGKTAEKEELSPTNTLHGYLSSKSLTKDKGRKAVPLRRVERFFGFKTNLIWGNILFITMMHLATAYCLITFNYRQEWRTLVWMYVMYIISGFGGTAGVHRYWTHRSYKAKRPFQAFLVICFSSAGQNRIFDWVRDHRVHHKFTDTDADPHNSKRGFFFSHVGWLMMKRHPQVLEKGRQIDMSDIKNDRLLVLADKYYTILKIIFCFLLPTIIPVYGWGETWTRAFISQGIMRYVVVLNFTWSVNSAAHIWGMKPYDKSIRPCDNTFVAYVAGGEGWHNYHHVFPWDYKTSEWGGGIHNLSTFFLDLAAKAGWVYDRKEPSQKLIKAVSKRTGDGSRPREEEIPFDTVESRSKDIITTDEDQS